MDGYNQPPWEQSYNSEGSSYSPPPYSPAYTSYPPSYPPPYSHPSPNPPTYYPPHDYDCPDYPPYHSPQYENPPYSPSPFYPPELYQDPPPPNQVQEGYNPYAATSAEESSERIKWMLQTLVRQNEDIINIMDAIEQRDQERHLEEQRRFEFLEQIEEEKEEKEEESYDEEEYSEEVEEEQEEKEEERIEEMEEEAQEGYNSCTFSTTKEASDKSYELLKAAYQSCLEVLEIIDSLEHMPSEAPKTIVVEEEKEVQDDEDEEVEEGDDQEASQVDFESEISLSKPFISSIYICDANDSVDYVLPLDRIDHKKEVRKVLGIVGEGRWKRRRKVPNLHKVQVWGSLFMNVVKACSPVHLSLIPFEPQRLRYKGKRDYYPWPFR